ncbi:MAG: hypothetical protein GY754_36530 [bacterium]|nr:hypothetical protein [bacterium]
MSTASRCKKCILPEYGEEIVLNEDGVCNVCSEFTENKTLEQRKTMLETDLIKTLNKYKKKAEKRRDGIKYDCLIMCSGGKDSTMALYHMKKRYNMNPLVLTFDHGFENETALNNVKNACHNLGVDWVYYKTDFMKEVFSEIIKSKTKATICHICSIWYIDFSYAFAARYQIPLIIAGWTKGQLAVGKESGNPYEPISSASTDFIKNYLHKKPAYKDFPLTIGEALKKAQKRFKTEMVSPHWYMNWDPDEMREILKNELNWELQEKSYPAGSTNCMMNFVSVYLSLQNYGYTHYDIEMSKQIRSGDISRDEALKCIELNFDKQTVDEVLSTLNCELN